MPIRSQRPEEVVPVVPVANTDPYPGGLLREQSSSSGLAGSMLRNTDRGQQFGVTTPVSGAPTGLPGSPLNTLYGVDSESYLTDEQKKLSRMIQGKFDASLNSRDRALQRYGAPQLSSYVEDEALARAMSLARGLNFPEKKDETPVDARGLIRNAGTAPRPNTQPGGRAGAPAGPTGANSGAQNAASWQRIMSGLASVVPLLFGKDAYGQFLNKGLIQSVKEALYGPEKAAMMSDEQLHTLLDSQPAYPTQAATDYWSTQSAPWGQSAEGGLPYPTPELSVDTDWANWAGEADYGNWFPTGSEWDFGSLAGP